MQARKSSHQNPGCWHPNLGLLASKTDKINFCCLRHLSHGILLWQPELTNYYNQMYKNFMEKIINYNIKEGLNE